MTIQVLLADDQPLVRAGLRMLIEQTSGIDVAGEAGTGTEAAQRPGTPAPTWWYWTSACPAWTASRQPS